MESLLRYIIENIVDNPKEVKITQQENNDFINLELSVDPEDMGRVIGKNGKIIASIRKLLRIKAVKLGKKVNLVLVEPQAE